MAMANRSIPGFYPGRDAWALHQGVGPTRVHFDPVDQVVSVNVGNARLIVDYSVIAGGGTFHVTSRHTQVTYPPTGIMGSMYVECDGNGGPVRPEAGRESRSKPRDFCSKYVYGDGRYR